MWRGAHSCVSIFLARTGEKEYFDAFVSCNTQDDSFVKNLITKLEKENGFKLCVPERDMMPGGIATKDTAELILKR